MTLMGDGEIELYGTRLKVTAQPVIETLVSVFPGKIVIGDNRRADDPVASSYVMEDWTGGALKRWMDPETDFDRFYHAANLSTVFSRQVCLGPQVRTIAPMAWGDTVTRYVKAGADYLGVMHVCWDEKLVAVSPTETLALKGTLNAPATKMLTYRLQTGANAGLSRLFIATDDGTASYLYYWDGTTLTGPVAVETCRAMVVWDDKLVKIGDDGILRYTTDNITWTDLSATARVPVARQSLTALLVFPNADLYDSLHICCRDGLYFYDEALQKVRRTRLKLPDLKNQGKGSVVHKDNLYFHTTGMGIDRYTGTIVAAEGVDRDDGLPSAYRGEIQQMADSINFLVAASMTTQVATPEAPVYGGDEMTAATTAWSTQGYAALWIQERIGGGWHNLYLSDLVGAGCYWVDVSSSDDLYRLWFGVDASLLVIDLYGDIHNPLDNSQQQYRETGELVTPWNEMGWSEIVKTAVEQSYGVTGCDQTLCTTAIRPACNIVVEYGLDGDENTWYPLTTITSNTPARTQYGTEDLGIAFKSMRFRFTLSRCDDAAHTPVGKFSTLTFTKDMPARWGYRLMIDCTQRFGILEPEQQASFIRRLADPEDLGATLGVFKGWVDGEFTTRRVRVSEITGQLEEGTAQKGMYQVALVAY